MSPKTAAFKTVGLMFLTSPRKRTIYFNKATRRRLESFPVCFHLTVLALWQTGALSLVCHVFCPVHAGSH